MEVPLTESCTVTPMPDGVKSTLPGPSVTSAYDATTLDEVSPSTITLSSVRPVACAASYPSIVTVGVTLVDSEWKSWMAIPV